MKRTLCVLAAMSAMLSLVPASAAPSNDDIGSAAKISRIPAISFVREQATSAPGEDTSCGFGGSVWYSWRARSAEPLTISAQNQIPSPFSGSPTVQVYAKNRSALTSLACASPSVTFTPQAGAHYLFRIVGGSLVEIRWSYASSSDDVAQGAPDVVAPPLPFEEVLGIDSSGLSAGEPAPTCGVAGGGRWRTYAAHVTGLYKVHVDSRVPIYLQVYAEQDDGSPSPVVGGCAKTVVPDRSADVFVLLEAGDRIYAQFGRNVEPGADDGGNFGLGFFSLTQTA